ncbi:hypothetical protein Spb1_17880 [Planctopirus ephydatiae]|uniref:Uncharacterized protein n=1 Tax=Planctopirus ephydatiae TaxID=2528019 RepID=A0A518GMW0_9PLAN|nr:hypothetical protein [Planctopirus ephydatiae]QDV29869.1 hypothetical protein Spb1_17880 [Planctopirus ephydatiae]
MAEISDIEEECEDLDWYAVDESGYIGHFATGGRGFLPRSVKNSSENRLTLHSFFVELPVSCAGIHNDAAGNNEFFLAMSGRGLYSYDYSPGKGRNLGYSRNCIPTSPLKVEVCPEEIQAILKHTISYVLFSQAENVSPQMFL